MPNLVEKLCVCVWKKEKRMEMQLAQTKCEWKWQKTQVKCAETKILIANALGKREGGESEREEEEAEIYA